MDAALDPDEGGDAGIGFEDFAQLVGEDSSDSLASPGANSFDLYDSRYAAHQPQDLSLHGAGAHGEHYHPGLITVRDVKAE